MDRETTAIELMESFAEETGLIGDRPPRRYLWTDAYAVCNFISLDQRLPYCNFMGLARLLINQVHDLLGRTVDDRQPLGGMDEAEWAIHPTRAGLRIGKSLPERSRGQSFDEQLEWERDGQYFHYLTRWMHALEQFALASSEDDPHQWAVDLCQASLAFVVRDDQGKPLRMVWKRSVDLDRVLVESMGQHDPLDGWVTANELEHSPFSSGAERSFLASAVETFRALDSPRSWPTADPLGLGGLLTAASRRWHDRFNADSDAVHDVEGMLEAAARGLQAWIHKAPWSAPAAQRLAFRELGLGIGLRALDSIRDDSIAGSPISRATRNILQLAAAMPDLASFWCEPRNQAVPSWSAHHDINAVMLAASLILEEVKHVQIRS